MGTEQNPVWCVYDLLRTARLNVKYYSGKLYKVERNILLMDILLAITAPSSSVAGLWFWEDPIGKKTWQYLGAIAAFVAIIKPLLGLPKKLKEYEELRSGYRALEHDLYEIKEMIVHKGKYDKQLQDDYSKALKRKGVLVTKEPDNREDKKLKSKCVEQVNRELPVDLFYVP